MLLCLIFVFFPDFLKHQTPKQTPYLLLMIIDLLAIDLMLLFVLVVIMD